MTNQYAWGDDLLAPVEDSVGTEAFLTGEPIAQFATITQGPCQCGQPSFFNPANIVVEDGVIYTTLYVCRLSDDKLLTQRLALWFGSLKETDHVKLSVAATVTNIPFGSLITILAAIANTKAKIEILLDQIVVDGLAYFYLLADKITPMDFGGLFIPSFIDQRREDIAAPQAAIVDFYQWIVEDAVVNKHLTQEEADRLNAGSHVIIPLERFT